MTTELVRLQRHLPVQAARFTIAVGGSRIERLAFWLGLQVIRVGCFLAGLDFEAQQREVIK